MRDRRPIRKATSELFRSTACLTSSPRTENKLFSGIHHRPTVSDRLRISLLVGSTGLVQVGSTCTLQVRLANHVPLRCAVGIRRKAAGSPSCSALERQRRAGNRGAGMSNGRRDGLPATGRAGAARTPTLRKPREGWGTRPWHRAQYAAARQSGSSPVSSIA